LIFPLPLSPTHHDLSQLPEDTPQFYKTRLRDFRVLEFLMRSRLEARYFTVPPMGSRVATERFV
jgi:hypothetical protein